MTKRTLLLFFILSCLQSKAQIELYDIELIQGVWAWNFNSEDEQLYKIQKGNRSLNLSFTKNENELDFYLDESFAGFQNHKSTDVDSINVDWLALGGRYYTFVIDLRYVNKNGWVSIENCIVPWYFSCDGELMSINGGKLYEYEKTSTLPIEHLKKLFYRGKLDNRDYIKDYLGLKVIGIKSTKTNLYLEPNKKTKASLKKGDIVVVIEEAGKWLKIKYDAINVGWIKKGEVQ